MNGDRPGEKLRARDRRCTWHPYTQHALDDQPLAVVSAHGALLELEGGKTVIDAISSWWTCLHGHAEKVLIDAMTRQARQLDHVLFAGATHEPAVGLAEDLVQAAPSGLTRVFYSDDGSTAVEVALTIVRQSWVNAGERERSVFIELEHGYHGDTFGAMSVGDPDPFFRPFTPMLFEVVRAQVATSSVAAALSQLGKRAAGLILEPLIQGAGGMRMHSTQFLQDVRELCTRAQIPLIADEVMTGFGRSGSLFACELAGIQPDLMCLAKGLSGGLFPLAATLATEALYESFLSSDRSKALFHGHSFTAHPVGCAVARASLELCANNQVPSRFERIGSRIEGFLTRKLARDARVRELRRRGGVVALELEREQCGYLAGDSLRMRRAALDRGVLVRPLGNVLYAMPPACTSDDQCDAIGDALCELARLEA